MLTTFLFGAMTTSLLINWARRQKLHGEYAWSLGLEAGLLLLFGLLGANLRFSYELVAPATVLLLCFVMGLQNAVVSKISQAEIRTTHMTGIVTDLGIELGRLIYLNRNPDLHPRHFVKADRDRLAIHAAILTLFLGGGLVGALAFRALGFAATIPIAALLAVVAAPPLLRDAASIARIGFRS